MRSGYRHGRLAASLNRYDPDRNVLEGQPCIERAQRSYFAEPDHDSAAARRHSERRWRARERTRSEDDAKRRCECQDAGDKHTGTRTRTRDEARRLRFRQRGRGDLPSHHSEDRVAFF